MWDNDFIKIAKKLDDLKKQYKNDFIAYNDMLSNNRYYYYNINQGRSNQYKINKNKE